MELISKIISHENHKATQVYKAQEIGDVILMAAEDTAKVLQPSEQPLDLPAPFVAAQGPTVLGRRLDPIAAVRGDQLDTLLLKRGVQFVAVTGFVANHSFRGIGDKPVLESIRDKGDFMRRSRCNVYGDRKTISVCYSHDLRTFAPLGCSHAEPPFFATRRSSAMRFGFSANSATRAAITRRAQLPCRPYGAGARPLRRSARHAPG